MFRAEPDSFYSTQGFQEAQMRLQSIKARDEIKVGKPVQSQGAKGSGYRSGETQKSGIQGPKLGSQGRRQGQGF